MQNWQRKIFGIALGNTLVLYDFILYAFLGTTLAQVFFPVQSPLVALMSVFLIFASACLVRPIGGFLFGIIGDHYGRKTSLVTSIFLMCSASVLIGCLPSYHAWGETTVVLLVLLRMIQGISMSGEEVGSAIYLIESAPENRKSVAGSIVLASVHIGLLFGAAIVLLCFQFIPTSQFIVWGWRVPFILSLPISMLVLYLRLKQADSNEFKRVKIHKNLWYPIKEVFKHYKQQLVLGTLICSLSSIAIYLYAVYLPNYLKISHHFTTFHVLLFNMGSFLISAFAVLGVGILGDKIGFIKPLKWASFSFIVLSPLAFSFATSQHLILVFLSQALFVIIVALSSGTLMLCLNNLFPIEIRFTGVATCFNFSMTLFGSTAPMIILAMQKMNTLPVFPALYMMLMGIIVFFSYSFYRTYHRKKQSLR